MAAAQGNRARAAGDTDAALWGGTTMTVAGVQVLISHDDLAGVLPTPPLAHLPGSPAWLAGVGGHAGEILCVIDSGAWLTRVPSSPERRRFCALLAVDGARFALTVDALGVDCWLPVSERDFEAPMAPALVPYSLGAFPVDGAMAPVLDGHLLMDSLRDAGLRTSDVGASG